MKSKHCSALVAAFALCSTIWMGTVAQAQPAGTITIGVVDEDKLADGFKKYQDAIKSLDERSKATDTRLAARSLLNADEAKTFDALIVKTTLTAAEETQMNGFVKTAEDRNTEYTGLIGKVTKTDADTARIKQLTDLSKNNQDAVRTMAQKLYDSLKKQQDDTDKQYTDQAKDTITKVAGERKFSLVVRSRGVIWNLPSLDITAEVLSRLNK